MKFKSLSLSVLSTTLFLASCSNNDDAIVEPEFNYTVPATYTFERNGA